LKKNKFTVVLVIIVIAIFILHETLVYDRVFHRQSLFRRRHFV